jgi:DNA modification methylase
MKIELIDIKKLKTDPDNVRLHDDDNLGAIKKSLLQFHQQKPLVVGKGNIVIAGNATLEAAKALGWTKIAIVRTTLAGKQAMAYAIADNKTSDLSFFDDSKLADQLKELQQLSLTDFESTGFDQSSLDGLLASIQEDQAPIEDEAPEPPKVAKSKLGDLYLLGEHRLLCGDATKKEDVERLMDGQKVDMVFTDPPYGVAYANKNKYLNAISRGNRIQTEITNDHKTVVDLADSVIYPAFCQVKEILAARASYYITAPQGGDLLMMMMMMMKAGLTLRHMIIWVKNNHVLGRTDYNYKHEPILFGWVDRHNFHGCGEHLFSTWEIPKPQKSDLHPTMKPIALIANALLNSSKVKNSIADLFGGSGSTLIACEQLNRKCFMLEIDPKYIDVIVERWEKFTGGKAKLEKATKCPKTTKS